MVKRFSSSSSVMFYDWLKLHTSIRCDACVDYITETNCPEGSWSGLVEYMTHTTKRVAIKIWINSKEQDSEKSNRHNPCEYIQVLFIEEESKYCHFCCWDYPK